MTYDLLRFFALAKRLVSGCVLAGAALCSSVAFSQALPSTPYPFPVTTAGNVRAYQGGTATAANAASFGYGNAANSPVYARVNTTHGLPNGQSVPVQTKSYPSSANVGKALGNFAKKVLPVISTAVAIKQLLEELGYNIGQDSQGNNVVQKPGIVPAGCYVAPCYSYVLMFSNGAAQGTYPSLAEAQAVFQAAKPHNYWVKQQRSPETSSFWSFMNQDGSIDIYQAVVYGAQRQPDADPGTPYEPATWEEIEAEIAANNQTGWPTGSAAPDALRDAVASGEPLPLPEPSEVTGPVSAPGPSKTSTQTNKDAQGNPTGTTTSVTNTTYNISYGPNTITTTTTNTTNITNPDGTTETVEDAAQESVPEEEPQPDQCEKYPDIAGCAELDTPDDEVPSTTKTVTYAAEDLGFGAGACPPPYVVSTSLGQVSLDLGPYCTALTNYVRPAVILVATFLAFLIVTGAKLGGDD